MNYFLKYLNFQVRKNNILYVCKYFNNQKLRNNQKLVIVVESVFFHIYIF